MNWKKAALALVLCLSVMLTGCISKIVTVEDVSKYVQLGEYKGIAYTPDDTTVTQEQHDSAVEQLLGAFAETEEILEGAVEEGDTINFNYTGLKNGVKVENAEAQGATVTLGSGTFIPGFEESIIGHNIGEGFSFDVTFPADYQAEELRGQLVTFDILINSKTVAHLPELTDEFVQTNFSTEEVPLKSVDEFNTWLDEQLLTSNITAAESNRVGTIWSKVVENATIKQLPKKDVEAYYNNYKDQYQAYADYYSQSYGTTISLEMLVTQMFGITMDEFEAELTAEAETACKEQLVSEAIAYAEGINVTTEELNAGAAEIAASAGLNNVQEVFDTYGKQMVFDTLLQEKVLEFVCDNAVANK